MRGGQLPQRGDRHHAYLITGSASGVYDGEPWIEALKTFVQEISGRTPLVGICFYLPTFACTTVSAAMFTMRRTVTDGVSTFTGAAQPSRIGPIATLWPAAVLSRL